MSAGTPPDSKSPAAPSPANASESTTTNDPLTSEYLRSRGYDDAPQSGAEPASPKISKEEKLKKTLSADEFQKSLVVFANNSSRSGENIFKDSSSVLQAIAELVGPNLQGLIASVVPAGAEELLSLDPSDKREGFHELEAWVDGSLDMYRREFRPILFPIFCHFYLDLIERGFRDSALDFHDGFSSSISSSHRVTVHHLRTLLLPAHVQSDELAQRFRNEKFVIRMSRSGFGLLVGWLTEGFGGEALGAGDGFSGEKGKKGRASVMRVVNNHLRFDVTSSNPCITSPTWEGSTGLFPSPITQSKGSHASGTSKGELKLGPPPISDDLRAESERVLREQAMVERDPSASFDVQFPKPTSLPGLTIPSESELLPHSSFFQTVDVEREVASVRDARRRIRLDPSLLASDEIGSLQAGALRSRALPSICAYTLHDVAEGSPCCTFSLDTSLMAAGFEESYIRLWSLKGERLLGLRSDFSANSIKDASSIQKVREMKGTTARKLIGHSGPVYSLAFDPVAGSAAPPKHLLSASADGTTRLWSMDTLTNVVAYRGHGNPVWDVKWSPLGIYFATASRDRTARLWSSDRSSCLRIFTGHLSDVNCIQFHPNAMYLATGSSDCTVKLWGVQDGKDLRNFIGHQAGVSALTISPDGRYLASAGDDLAINLWDIGEGKLIKKMSGHTASIYSLSFSAESTLLVSGGADCAVRCWDIKSPGGIREKPRQNGSTVPIDAQVEGNVEEGELLETKDLVATFPTKKTPVTNVHFTSRNLCIISGVYHSPEFR